MKDFKNNFRHTKFATGEIVYVHSIEIDTNSAQVIFLGSPKLGLCPLNMDRIDFNIEHDLKTVNRSVFIECLNKMHKVEFPYPSNKYVNQVRDFIEAVEHIAGVKFVIIEKDWNNE